MLEQKVSLKVKNGEHVYEFICTSDSPLGEIYDALCRMKSYVVGRVAEEEKASKPPEEIPTEIVT